MNEAGVESLPHQGVSIVDKVPLLALGPGHSAVPTKHRHFFNTCRSKHHQSTEKERLVQRCEIIVSHSSRNPFNHYTMSSIIGRSAFRATRTLRASGINAGAGKTSDQDRSFFRRGLRQDPELYVSYPHLPSQLSKPQTLENSLSQIRHLFKHCTKKKPKKSSYYKLTSAPIEITDPPRNHDRRLHPRRLALW